MISRNETAGASPLSSEAHEAHGPAAEEWGVRTAAAVAILIGGFWLAAWIGGQAASQSAAGMITTKTNMALGQLLAGCALLLLGTGTSAAFRRWPAVLLSAVVLLIGILSLSQHIFGWNLGIDQLLAEEPAGAAATASPNRMGPPGSLSLTILGLGLLSLAFRWRRIVLISGVAVAVMNLVPAVGFLYGIGSFYATARVTGIAWPTVIALFCLGSGLVLAARTRSVALMLRGDDPGGMLARQLLPVAIFVPLILGLLKEAGERQGLYSASEGTGMLVIALILIFSVMLLFGARRLSRSATAQRESERRFSEAFVLSPAAMAIGRLDDGRIVDVNDSFLSLYEFSRDEVIGSTTAELDLYVNPDERERLVQLLRQQGKVRDHETMARTKGGKLITVLLSLEVIEIDGQEHTISTIIDVTERKRMEETLKESEERFRVMANELPALIWATNAEGRIELVNRAYEQFFGVTEEQMRGPNGWQPLMHPEDVGAYVEAFKECLRNRRPFDAEARVRRADGEWRWVQSTSGPRFSPSGEFLGHVGSSRDITARKQAESVVQASLRMMTAANVGDKSLNEIITGVLDEVERLTCSQIGFYHFLENDQETLSLQCWSTNTLRNKCTAEGSGSHYAVSEAGIWVDCVRERRPVIHNDYASVPHRKGLPPGHAPVVRELVVPIIRSDRIVAIIGVGNKPTDYDERDVEIASYLGDLSWAVIERKRAEEQLRQAEEHKLEFYQRTIMAATGDKLVLTEAAEIERIAGPALASWSITEAKNLPSIRHAVRAVASDAGIDDDRTQKFETAVGEATANALKHGGGGTASIHRRPDSLMVMVSDRGPGIPALVLPDVAARDRFSTAGTAGLGYRFMLSFSDRLYLSTGDTGTTLALEIRIVPTEDTSQAECFDIASAFGM